MKSKELNSKQAITRISEIDNLVDLEKFISEDEDRKTVLKAKEDRLQDFTVEETEVAKEAEIVIESIKPSVEKPKTIGGKGRVKFISNGSNPRLGPNGTVKNPSERNAMLFVRNGWGRIDA